MPEGDTVWRAARHLHEALAGRALTRTDFRVPAFATVDLSGSPVDEVVSRGKHLLIRTPEDSIHSHLKMEGAWHVYRLGSPWRRPGHTARAVLENDEWQAVGYSLGILEVLPRSDEQSVVGHLGPDLLGADWDLDEAARRVAADPDRPVFLALLDQRNVAGFGNEYANELLFLMGLLPTRPVGEVADIRRVISRGPTDARPQQVTRRPLVHRQHPHRRGTLGLRPRAIAVPSLRHAVAPRHARRSADRRAQHVLVPAAARPDARWVRDVEVVAEP